LNERGKDLAARVVRLGNRRGEKVGGAVHQGSNREEKTREKKWLERKKTLGGLGGGGIGLKA